MVKKECAVLFLLFSMVMLSGCDVYDTMYAEKPALQEGAEIISADDIIAAGDIDSLNDTNADAAVSTDISMEIPEDDQPAPSSDAAVILAQETEKVSLQPKAQDPDNDVLAYSFTSPLNENGEWQTIYGDAGEYTVTVTASDGTLTASKQALIIIKRKEEIPTLEKKIPDTTALSLRETESREFAVVASDLNKDTLSYDWKLDGNQVSESDSYHYESSYEDAGSHTVKVSISDGLSSAENIWAVSVENVNRKPRMEQLDDIDAKETDMIVIELEAVDDDNDRIEFKISDSKFMQDGNVFTWQTGFDDAGEHQIRVSTSDGTDETSQDIMVRVANVNRAPVILDIVQKT